MTKILLVEDDKSLREIYGVRLLAEGYDIVSAGDGEEALAMAIKEKPTLIISDVMMPKISGFDMLDILRSTTETRDIKVIMMTALSSEDQKNRGEQLGADRYLVKSQVGIEDVVRTVHEVLADTPGGAPTPAVAAPVPAAEPVVEPVTTPTPEPVEPASVAPIPDPVPAPAATEEPAPTSAAPGNEAAGPLPPQPTEIESTLPQPTAPFSSPRPANLGERVIQPLDVTEPATDQPESADSSVVSPESLVQELQASAEPIANTQVDEAISDADVATDLTEPVTPGVTPAIPPSAPAVNLDPTSTLPTPELSPLESEKKDEATPPLAAPGVPPVPPTTPPLG